MSLRVPVAVRVLVAGLALGVSVLAVISLVAGSPAPARVPTPPADVVAGPSPFAVLHEWDRRRSAAWSAGDTAALSRLYTVRSTAGSSDVALLRRYVARGLRVRDMRMQLLGARVLVRRPWVIALEVVDRLDDAVVVRSGELQAARRLPSDGATTHRLVLRLVAGRWRMARVSVVGSGGVGP
jgi:hypothetical protein